MFEQIYHLVILDVELTGTQDLEIIQEFRQLEEEILDNYKSKLPLIVYFSDFSGAKEEFIQAALQLGADKLINKK